MVVQSVRPTPQSHTLRIRYANCACAATVGIAGLLLSCGCARPSTSNWAQTSQVMTASSTTNTTISLGAAQDVTH
jgi:hypothetical protein